MRLQIDKKKKIRQLLAENQKMSTYFPIILNALGFLEDKILERHRTWPVDEQEMYLCFLNRILP